VSDKLADRVGLVVLPLGFLSLLSVPAIWAYQIYHWLRWGEAPHIPVSEALQWFGLSEPQFAWAGVQKVSDWVMAAPLSFFLFFVILAFLFAFIGWANHRETVADQAAKEAKEPRNGKANPRPNGTV